MKKIIIPAAAVALALSFSAFTSAKKVTSNFFEYTSSSLTESAIKNRANYQAASSDAACTASQNVCGVVLATAKDIGTLPDATEFSSQTSDLWASQQAHSPANGDIEMKP